MRSLSSEPIISVQALGKRYRLGASRSNQRYTALRDVISEKAKSVFRRSPVISDPSQDEFWALKNVSFEVKQGEVIGIIGRNGAGKSTLLKILSRITEPSEGKVRLKGRVASLLEVGTGFHPELTGRENVFLNGAILGMTRREINAKFDEIVAFAEVEKFLDTPVKRYSSGMYVRLAFAVAAHLEPEILVVDEVLAVGDAEFQKKCLGKMKDVATGEGRTVLFVSHNMAAVETLCGKCMLLKAGEIDVFSETAAAITRYIAQSNSSSQSTVDFASGKFERFGPRESAELKTLSVVDEGGSPLGVVRMGAPLVVILQINFKEAGPQFEIGVAVSNIYGVYLHYLISNWEGLEDVTTIGDKTIEMTIPAIALFPGMYYLTVWVKRQGGAYDDAVHDALSFEVEEGPITSSPAYFGRYSHNSQVYVPSQWRFVK
jgi:lipopolysaccharide transport system ATP-binding protein